MKKYFFFLIILTTILFSQDFDKFSLKNKILAGGDLGLTFTSSDYKDVGVGLIIRGVAEYYFYETAVHKIGVRGFGGYGISSGSDNRFDPDGFNTHLYTIAAGGIYSYQFSDAVAPYIFAGLKYLRFNPKDNDGNTLPNNSAEMYDRNTFNVAFEFGLRYRLSDEIFGYSSLTPLNITNDNIDDRASGSAKDLVVSLNFGLLYKFDAPWSGSKYNTVEEEELPKGINEELREGKDAEAVEIKEEKSDEAVVDKISDDEEMHEKRVEAETEIAREAETSKSNIVEELTHKLEFSRVNFDFGKTELDRMEYVELDRLLKIIEKDKNSRWKIIGYTDNVEPVQVHQSLAIQRAYFVMRYFMSKGIDRERFEIIVKGEEDPIGDNSTEEGRAKNRRVEILKMN